MVQEVDNYYADCHQAGTGQERKFELGVQLSRQRTFVDPDGWLGPHPVRYSPSPYHVVRPQQDRFGYRELQSLGGLEVDNQLELGRLLDR